MACTASAGLVQLAPLRSWLVAGCLTLALVACGGGSLSLTEYAERLSGLAGNYVRIEIEGGDELRNRFATVSVDGADADRTWGTVDRSTVR